jgi:hypothetical protein
VRTEILTRSPTSREVPWMNGAAVFAVAVMQVLGLWLFPGGLTDVARDGRYVAPTRVHLLVQRRWVC